MKKGQYNRPLTKVGEIMAFRYKINVLAALKEKGYTCPSDSYIVPMIVGKSSDTILKAEELQRHGFYALPVRPPTVPEGTSRIRFSLTAEIREEEIRKLIKIII